MKEFSASVTSILRGQPVCIYLRYLSSNRALHIPHGKLNIGITIRNKTSVIFFVIYLRNFKEKSALFPPKSTSEMHRRQRSSLKAVRIRDQLGFSSSLLIVNVANTDVKYSRRRRKFHRSSKYISLYGIHSWVRTCYEELCKNCTLRNKISTCCPFPHDDLLMSSWSFLSIAYDSSISYGYTLSCVASSFIHLRKYSDTL